jgi:hypothetical protein
MEAEEGGGGRDKGGWGRRGMGSYHRAELIFFEVPLRKNSLLPRSRSSEEGQHKIKSRSPGALHISGTASEIPKLPLKSLSKSFKLLPPPPSLFPSFPPSLLPPSLFRSPFPSSLLPPFPLPVSPPSLSSS